MFTQTINQTTQLTSLKIKPEYSGCQINESEFPSDLYDRNCDYMQTSDEVNIYYYFMSEVYAMVVNRRTTQASFYSFNLPSSL